MFNEGYLRIASWRGAPIRVHWSVIPGAWIFGGFQLDAVSFAAYFLLVLLHELGHATVVRATGQDLVSVDVHALGGVCQWSGSPTARQRALIAWGGVLAQALLLAGTEIWLRVHGAPVTLDGARLVHAFTRTNINLIALNLMPVRPLDGAEAWKVFSPLVRRVRRWRLARRPAPRRTPLVPAPPRPRRALPGDGEAPDPPLPEELRRSVERIFEESRQRRG